MRVALLYGGPNDGQIERPFNAVKTIITQDENWYTFSHEREDGVLIYKHEENRK